MGYLILNTSFLGSQATKICHTQFIFQFSNSSLLAINPWNFSCFRASSILSTAVVLSFSSSVCATKVTCYYFLQLFVVAFELQLAVCNFSTKSLVLEVAGHHGGSDVIINDLYSI